MSKPSSTQPSKFTEFPQELIDEIIDALQADNLALSNSSLISRAWLTRSRNHLFRTLRISEGRTTPPPHRFRAFLFFLQSASLHLRSTVETLHLFGASDSTHGRDAIVSLKFLALLVVELPHLKVLKLESVQVEKPQPEIKIEDPDTFDLATSMLNLTTQILSMHHLSISDSPPPDGIQELILINVMFYHNATAAHILVPFLNLFPNLKSVELERLAFHHCTDPLASPKRDDTSLVHQQLESLKVAERYGSSYQIFPLIQKLQPPNRLQRLDLPCGSLSDLQTLVKTLSNYSMVIQLTHLSLCLFEGHYVSNSGAAPLILSECCPSLQNLNFIIYLHRSPSDLDPTDIDYGINAIQTLSPSIHRDLRHISLRFRKTRDFLIESQRIGDEIFRWEALDDALSELVQLTRFEFGYTYNDEELRDSEKFFVQDKLPEVRAMGIMHVI